MEDQQNQSRPQFQTYPIAKPNSVQISILTEDNKISNEVRGRHVPKFEDRISTKPQFLEPIIESGNADESTPGTEQSLILNKTTETSKIDLSGVQNESHEQLNQTNDQKEE